MQIKRRPRDCVVPYGKNPRVNDGATVEVVARSTRTFAFRPPIVVDKVGVTGADAYNNLETTP